LNKSKTLRFELGYIGSFGLTDRSGPVEETSELNIISEKTTIKTFGGYAGLKLAF